jgi:hypothetical protein
MGYWVHFLAKSPVAIIHRDTSPHPICQWSGKRQGEPQPESWQYHERVPKTLSFHDQRISLIPCMYPECMNNTLNV